MSTTHILYLVETAFAEHLKAQSFTLIPATSVYPGIFVERAQDGEIVEMKLPRVICACQSAEPADPHTGGWGCTVEVSVQTSADDHLGNAHHLNATEVFGAILTDTLAADLMTAMPDLVVDAAYFRSQKWSVEDRAWTSTQTIELSCRST